MVFSSVISILTYWDFHYDKCLTLFRLLEYHRLGDLEIFLPFLEAIKSKRPLPS